MNRAIRFRVWDYVTNSFDNGLAISTLGQVGGWHSGVVQGQSIRYAIDQFTGLTDSQGREIYENDIVLASEARYETVLAESHNELDTPVYITNHDKPLPAPDVPWFKAVVEWNQDMCGYWLRYLEKRADWGPSAATPLNDKHYAYTVIGNIHEQNT